MGLLLKGGEVLKKKEKQTENLHLHSPSQKETKLPKRSLRDRALAFLANTKVVKKEAGDYVLKQRSFLQRAKELLAKLSGSEKTDAKDVSDKDSTKATPDGQKGAQGQVNEKDKEVKEESKEGEEEYIKVKKSEIGDFFEKIANTLKGIELSVKDTKDIKDQADKIDDTQIEPDDDSFEYKIESEDHTEEESSKTDRSSQSGFFEDRPDLASESAFDKSEIDDAEKTSPPHRIQPSEGIKGFYPKGKIPSLEDYLSDAYGLPAVPLSYRAHEIILPGSPYDHLRHNLEQAERYIAAGDLEMASDAYSHTMGLIHNEEIRNKIAKNIQDIARYLSDLDKRKRDTPPVIVLPGNSANNENSPNSANSASSEKSSNVADSPPPPSLPDDMGSSPKTQDSNISTDKVVQEISKGFFEMKEAFVEAGNINISAPNLGNIPNVTAGPATNEIPENLAPAAMPYTGAPPAGHSGTPEAGGLPAQEPPSKTSGDEEAGKPSEENEATGNDEPSPEDGEEKKTNEADTGQENDEGPQAMGSGMPQGGVMNSPSIPSIQESEGGMDSQEMSSEESDDPKESGPVQEIRGVLELKPPDEEDTPFLTLTYDFTRIPHQFYLARDHNVFEYAYYKYKPMLAKAQHFIRRKQITRALNYYRVIREQQIPKEFRRMIDQNISDITEYLQKYLMARQ